MKKYACLLLVIINSLILSCSNKYDRQDHRRTTELAHQLYVETYVVFGSGAFGTDIVSQYLTDSTSFREYVGTFDEGPEYYYYRVSGDTIYIEKYNSSEGKNSKKLLEKKLLLISDLKKTNTIR